MKSAILATIFSGALSSSVFPGTMEEFRLQDDSMSSLFDRYLTHFGKSYSVAEKREHFAIFEDRVAKIFDWNRDSKSFVKGINKFTDLDDISRREFVMPETSLKDV
jgi:hypothetical protein